MGLDNGYVTDKPTMWDGAIAAATFLVGIMASYLLIEPALLKDNLWVILCAFFSIATLILSFFPKIFDGHFLIGTLALMILGSLEWTRTTFEAHFVLQNRLAYEAMIGKFPFVDTINYQTCVFDQILGWSMRLFGPTHLTVQTTTIIMTWIGLVGIYSVARKILPQWAAALSGVLYILLLGTTVKPWGNYFLCGFTLVLIALLFHALPKLDHQPSKKQTVMLFVAGLIAGLLPWVRQQGVFPLLSAMIAWPVLLWLRGCPFSVAFKRSFFLITGVVISFGGILLAIILKGGFANMLEYYVELSALSSSGSASDLDLVWYQSILSIARRLLTPFESVREYSWLGQAVNFMDYGLIILLLVVAVVTPFWRRYALAISDGDNTTNYQLPDALAACFITGMILLPRHSENYPIFEGFRMAAAFSGGALVVVCFILRWVVGRGVRAKMRWLVPIAVVSLIVVFSAHRIIDISRHASSALAVEWNGYPAHMRSDLRSPALQGMRLAQRPASYDATISYILDGLNTISPETPVILFEWGWGTLQPAFLIGRPQFASPQPLWNCLAKWPKEIQDQFKKNNSEYMERVRPIILGPSNLRRQYPVVADYISLCPELWLTSNYHLRHTPTQIHCEPELAKRFDALYRRRFNLEETNDFRALLEGSNGILTDRDGALFVSKAGAVPLDFIYTILGQDYANLPPWLLLELEAGDSRVPLRVYRRDAADGTPEGVIERTLSSDMETAFMRLDRAGPERWFVEFGEAAVGKRIARFELHALTPPEVSEISVSRANFNSERYDHKLPLLGYEKRLSWIQDFGKVIEFANLEIKEPSFVRIGIALETSRGVLRSGSEVDVNVEIKSENGTTVLKLPILDSELNRWIDREIDLTGFTGQKVTLRLQVQAEKGRAHPGIYGRLCIENPLVIFNRK